MDTHKHTYTDTDSALITSENTEAENRKRGRTLRTLVILLEVRSPPKDCASRR